MMARWERAMVPLLPQPPCVSASGRYRIWAGRSPLLDILRHRLRDGGALALTGRPVQLVLPARSRLLSRELTYHTHPCDVGRKVDNHPPRTG
jgi:hypothetical protein